MGNESVEPIKVGDLVTSIRCGYRFNGECLICDHGDCWPRMRKNPQWVGNRPLLQVTGITGSTASFESGQSWDINALVKCKDLDVQDLSLNPWNM